VPEHDQQYRDGAKALEVVSVPGLRAGTIGVKLPQFENG
jgi:hypothetical protein